MIFTLTPNPSIDHSLTIPQIRFNSVLRSQKVRLDLGGKGFNISRSLMQFGTDSIAIAWVGGGTGKMLADGLQSLGIQTDFVWVEHDTRTNTRIDEEQGDWYIKVNEPGPPITKSDIEQLFQKVEGYAKKDDIWVLSGSLPPDVPDEFYADLIKLIKSRGVKVYLDTSGPALRYGCQAVPYLVKPNAREAASIVGFDVHDREDAKRAALPFLRMGIDYLAITMGSEGLLFATQHEMIHAKPPKIKVKNESGAGDSLLAGLIYAQIREWEPIEVARWAVATGAAASETEGVSEFDVRRVQEILPEVESKVVNVM
jgi:1-phosphofructokinase family hexose kinase